MFWVKICLSLCIYFLFSMGMVFAKSDITLYVWFGITLTLVIYFSYKFYKWLGALPQVTGGATPMIDMRK